MTETITIKCKDCGVPSRIEMDIEATIKMLTSLEKDYVTYCKKCETFTVIKPETLRELK